MSEDRFLSALTSSKSVKKSKKRKKINESRHKVSKSKIYDIRSNVYETEHEKNLFAPKIKEIEKNLLELEENIIKPKKYYDYDDTEYKGIKNVKDFFICQLMKIIINQE